MEKYQEQIEKIYDLIVAYGLKVLMAIIVLIIGLWIIKRLIRIAGKLMAKREIDVSLSKFLLNLSSIGLKVLLLISIAGMVGIETTSFIAVIGAAGLAIGLALQGSLSNFAGGVMILLFKPFKVGDVIEAQGHIGKVKEINIFVTVLLNGQNKTIILPNAAVSNGSIVNFSTEGVMRIDLTIGISYDSDIKKAKGILLDVLNKHPKVLKDPAPFVGVSELADSSVNLAVRPHAKTEDYWTVYFEIYESGKEALDAAVITIPFPQMDVHLEKLVPNKL